jgi:hypothetical protein
VQIERENAEPCSFIVNHLVFAVGIGGGVHNVPQIPGAVRVFLSHYLFYLTFRIRKNTEARLCTLAITQGPGTMRAKKYWW